MLLLILIDAAPKGVNGLVGLDMQLDGGLLLEPILKDDRRR